MSTDPKVLVDNILNFYDTLKPKNPDNSYTVIATISNTCLSGESELIALATGTQANLRVYADDIEDCHAESIVKRAYKRYLIDKLLALVSKSKDLDEVNKFLLNNAKQNLTLFISQFPCGFLKRYQGLEPIDEISGKVIKRKPGRGTIKEGRIVYVEKDPCYDKLKRWLKEGVQGKRLKELFNLEGKITRLIIGNCENNSLIDYKLAKDNFQQSLNCDNYNERLQIELVDIVDRSEFFSSPNQQPQPISIVWWQTLLFDAMNHSNYNESSDRKNMELIVDGRRIGLTKKLLDKDLADHYKLKITNYWLKKDVDLVRGLVKQLHEQKSGT